MVYSVRLWSKALDNTLCNALYQRRFTTDMCFALGGRASPDDNALHVLFEVPRPIKARSSATEYDVLVGKALMYTKWHRTKDPRANLSCHRRGYIYQQVDTARCTLAIVGTFEDRCPSKTFSPHIHTSHHSIDNIGTLSYRKPKNDVNIDRNLKITLVNKRPDSSNPNPPPNPNRIPKPLLHPPHSQPDKHSLLSSRHNPSHTKQTPHKNHRSPDLARE